LTYPLYSRSLTSHNVLLIIVFTILEETLTKSYMVVKNELFLKRWNGVTMMVNASFAAHALKLL